MKRYEFQGIQKSTQVEVEVPLKQGLKPSCPFLSTNSPKVEVEVPLKQGLKQSSIIFIALSIDSWSRSSIKTRIETFADSKKEGQQQELK